MTLQRALLPGAPPALPGMRVAARYVAGTADVEVGGDWWDVHPLGEGRVGIGVGDVSGRGMPAAVLMGQARAGMRTAAHARLSPVELLTVLDAHVTDLVVPVDDSGHRLPAKFATAAYAIIDTAEGVLRVANAGHPPLLVRYPCGRVERVECPPGPPLGLGMGGYQEVSVPFPDGALLVAFTDGLVESSTVDVDTGIAAVERTVLDAGPDAPLDVLADKVLGLADGTDDTALVLLQRVDAPA
jgi:serine phosphatase RsbU (regulator of sigma subunit)